MDKQLLSNLLTLREIIDDFRIHMDDGKETISNGAVLSTLNEMDKILSRATDGLADVIL